MAMPPAILVVEDHLPTLQLLARLLTRAGYLVRTASDGEAAWAAITAEQPALVITDLVMPGVDGLALIAHLQRHYPQLPILALSAAGRGVAIPGVRFLAKPFSLAQVLATVRELLPGEAGTDLD